MYHMLGILRSMLCAGVLCLLAFSAPEDLSAMSAQSQRQENWGLAPPSKWQSNTKNDSMRLENFIGLLHSQQEAALQAGVDGFALDPVAKVVWGVRKNSETGEWKSGDAVRLGPMPPALQAALQVRPTEIWQEPLVIERKISKTDLSAIAENLLDPLLDPQIKPVADDEMILDRNHLPEYLWGDRTEMTRETHKLLKSAEKVGQKAMAIGRGDSLLVPMLRRSGNQTVHVIKKMDVERLAKHLGILSKAQAPLLQSDEVVLSSTGLGDYCHGSNATLDAILAKHLPDLEKQTQGPLMIGDIPCYRRYSGKNPVLAIKTADVPKLAAKLQLRLKGHGMTSTQIACTGSTLDRFFRAHKSRLNEIIARRLPDLAVPSKSSIVRGGITFIKSFSGKQPAWIVEIADVRKLGTYLGVDLKHSKLGAGEFACTGNHMGEHFRWETAEQEKQARARLPDPYRADASEMVAGDLRFVKRWVGLLQDGRKFRLEWAAMESEKVVVAAYFGLKPILSIPPLGDDEIAVSAQQVGPLFIGEYGKIAARIKALLPNIHSFADMEYITPHGIRFFKRRHGDWTVWAFSEDGIEKVAAETGLRVAVYIPKLQKGEVGISAKFLPKQFYGTRTNLVKKFAPHLPLLDSVDGMETEVELTHPDLPRVKVRLFKRLSGYTPVWAFRDADSLILGQYLDLRLKPKIPQVGIDEIRVTGESLAAVFYGQGKKLLRRARAILSEPDTGGVKFSQRLFKGSPVPVFHRADISKVAVLLNTVVRKKILSPRFDEITVSKSGLQIHFHENSKFLSNRVKMFLPNPITFQGNEYPVGDLIFYRRKVRNEIVWVFKERDKRQFSKMLETKMRTENDVDARMLAILIDQYRPLVGNAVNVLLDPALREKIIAIRRWEIQDKEKHGHAAILKTMAGLPVGDVSFGQSMVETKRSWIIENYADLSRKFQIAMMLGSVQTAEGKRFFSPYQATKLAFSGVATSQKILIQKVLFLLRLGTVDHEPFISAWRAIHWATTDVFQRAAARLLALGGRFPDVQTDDPAKWENQIPLRQFLARLETPDVIAILVQFTGKNSKSVRELLVQRPRRSEDEALSRLKSMTYEQVREMRRPGDDAYVKVLQQLGPLLFSLRKEVRREARVLLAEWHREFLGYYLGNDVLREKAHEIFFRSIFNYNPYHLWENGYRRIKRFDQYVRSGLMFVRHQVYRQGIPPELRPVIGQIRAFRKRMWQEKSEWPKSQEIATHLLKQGFSKEEVTGGITWIAGIVSLDNVSDGYKEDLYSRVSKESLSFEDPSLGNGNGNGTRDIPEDAVLDPLLMMEKLQQIAPDTHVWLDGQKGSLSLDKAARYVERKLASERPGILVMRYDQGEFIIYERSLAEIEEEARRGQARVEGEKSTQSNATGTFARWREMVMNKELPMPRRLEAIYMLRQAEAYGDLRELLVGPAVQSTNIRTEMTALSPVIRNEIIAALAVRKENLIDLVKDPSVLKLVKEMVLTSLGQHKEFESLESIVKDKRLPSTVRYQAIKNIDTFGMLPGAKDSLNKVIPGIEEILDSETQEIPAENADIVVNALARAEAYAILKKLVYTGRLGYRIRHNALRHVVGLGLQKGLDHPRIFVEDQGLPVALRCSAIRDIALAKRWPRALGILKELIPAIDKLLDSEAQGISVEAGDAVVSALVTVKAYASLKKIAYNPRLADEIRQAAAAALGKENTPQAQAGAAMRNQPATMEPVDPKSLECAA